MSSSVKILGQITVGTPGTPVSLYTVPASTTTVVSTLVICNQAGSAATFRVQVRIANAASATKQYIYYDRSIAANDSFASTIGMTLAATDQIYIDASATTVSFSLFGQETINETNPTIRVLGQEVGNTTTEVQLYSSGTKSAIISSITICNTSTINSFRLDIRQGTTSQSNAQMICRLLSVDAGDTYTMTLGITLAAGDYIYIDDAPTTMAFNVFGQENN